MNMFQLEPIDRILLWDMYCQTEAHLVYQDTPKSGHPFFWVDKIWPRTLFMAKAIARVQEGKVEQVLGQAGCLANKSEHGTSFILPYQSIPREISKSQCRKNTDDEIEFPSSNCGKKRLRSGLKALLRDGESAQDCWWLGPFSWA